MLHLRWVCPVPSTAAMGAAVPMVVPEGRGAFAISPRPRPGKRTAERVGGSGQGGVKGTPLERQRRRLHAMGAP